MLLLALMAVFPLGNLACALASDYATLMAARVLTSLAHGTFFASAQSWPGAWCRPTSGLRPSRPCARARRRPPYSACLPVPGSGLHAGWRATFWVVAAIGVVALAVLARFVPRDEAPAALPLLRDELAVLARPQVWLGLAMTVLGFAGVFGFYPYIQPMVMQVTGLPESAVSPVLLFGTGLAAGNILGGRLADRGALRAVLGSLAVQAVVLAPAPRAMPSAWTAVPFIGLLGVVALATVAPLQLRVLEQAEGAW